MSHENVSSMTTQKLLYTQKWRRVLQVHGVGYLPAHSPPESWYARASLLLVVEKQLVQNEGR